MNQTLSRREFLALSGSAAAAVALPGFPALLGSRPRTRSMIVLGIDGMDPALLTRFMEEGRMPHCRALMERGCVHRLRTSDPPQSPVAWSNFISGTNPGGHGIFDFIARDPATLIPYFSSARLDPPGRSLRLGDLVLPLGARRMRNLRKGPTFWTDLRNRGIDCTVIRMPANFPPTDTDALTLSGLGTPDIHGSYGIFTFYTDSPAEASRDVPGGRIERVALRDWKAECSLPGPANDLDAGGREVNVPFTVFVDPANPVAKVAIQGRGIILREGEWSGWVEVRFPMLAHVAEVPGICRFYLKRARNDFALYVSPVNMDPASPALPISTPPGYSRRLSAEVGRFHTQGMAEDTRALSAGVLGDDEYRQQATFVLEEQLRLYGRELARFQEGFFFFYFSSLDLNSHAFWRALDRGHPLHTPELGKRHGDFLPWLYSRMDEAVGRAMERLDGRTRLMVVSDHGFGSFRRQFNLNSWLMDSGYATPVRGATRGEAPFFADADWRETRAYGLGINALYLNLKGREPHGVVGPGEADALAEELRARLMAMRDPATGERVVSNVYRAAQVYSGPFAGEAPDLIVGYAANHRASWDTILGKYPREHLLDNVDPWSGDHALDSALMPGVLLSSGKLRGDDPSLCDMAPTILAEFGVPRAIGMTGRNMATA